LQQFLRLKLAGDMLSGSGKSAMSELKRCLSTGRSVEVAGYTLAPALAEGLQQATLGVPPRPGQLVWLEVSPSDQPTLLPGAAPVLARWRAAATAVEARSVHGPAFWQAAEIETAPALLAATLAMLCVEETA
jgi:hypothetical protein